MELKNLFDPLPIPSAIKPTGTYKGKPFYDVRMIETLHKFHSDLPKTKVWGYNGMVPGPTFEVKKDHPVYVRWSNDLPKNTSYLLIQPFTGPMITQKYELLYIYMEAQVNQIAMVILKHGLRKTFNKQDLVS